MPAAGAYFVFPSASALAHASLMKGAYQSRVHPPQTANILSSSFEGFSFCIHRQGWRRSDIFCPVRKITIFHKFKLQRRDQKKLSSFPINYLVEINASSGTTGLVANPPGERSEKSRSRFSAAAVTSNLVFERSSLFLQSSDFTIQCLSTFHAIQNKSSGRHTRARKCLYPKWSSQLRSSAITISSI